MARARGETFDRHQQGSAPDPRPDCVAGDRVLKPSNRSGGCENDRPRALDSTVAAAFGLSSSGPGGLSGRARSLR